MVSAARGVSQGGTRIPSREVSRSTRCASRTSRCSRRRPRCWLPGVHCLTARPPLLSFGVRRRKSVWIAPPVPANTLSYPAAVFTTEAGIADMHTCRGGALLRRIRETSTSRIEAIGSSQRSRSRVTHNSSTGGPAERQSPLARSSFKSVLPVTADNDHRILSKPPPCGKHSKGHGAPRSIDHREPRKLGGDWCTTVTTTPEGFFRFTCGSREEIKVHVVKYPYRANLVMRYVDPFTGRSVAGAKRNLPF